jgi:hypothetical protein
MIRFLVKIYNIHIEWFVSPLLQIANNPEKRIRRVYIQQSCLAMAARMHRLHRFQVLNFSFFLFYSFQIRLLVTPSRSFILFYLYYWY